MSPRIVDRPKPHSWVGGIEQRCVRSMACGWARRRKIGPGGKALASWQYKHESEPFGWSTMRRVPVCGSVP